MKQRFVLAVVLMCGTWPAAGEERGFKKPYFGATRPGSFARQKATDEKGAVTEYTYSRLADVAGERVIELSSEVLSGQFKGMKSVTGCLVPASFPLERDAIDFQMHARRCVAGSDGDHPGNHPTEYEPDTMKAIAEAMTNYAAIVTFKGTETVNGKRADRYGYEYKASYMNIPATTTGDLWLSDAVPFGLVKDVMTMRDASGKTLTRFETVLVQSGPGARTALPGWSWGDPGDRPAPANPGSRPRQECGGQPCCGDPPQPCGSWLAEQRAKAGAVVVEQVPPADCTVFVDGKEWPEGRRLRAFRFVPPGMHTVECRGPSGVLFSRRLEVAIGRDTPIFWGP